MQKALFATKDDFSRALGRAGERYWLAAGKAHASETKLDAAAEDAAIAEGLALECIVGPALIRSIRLVANFRTPLAVTEMAVNEAWEAYSASAKR